jgi:hypothetical protein
MVTKRFVLLAKGTPPLGTLVLRSIGGAGDLLDAEDVAGALAEEAAVAFRRVLPLVEVLRLLLFTSVDWLTCWSARGGRTGAAEAARELALLFALDLETDGTIFTGSPVDLTLLLPLERRLSPGVVDGDAVQDRW